ncbi:MAG: T9SS type A sorting domain-containing protein [Bacteroidota bacterium]
MKKNLLLVASLFVGASAFAQFDQSNEPAVSDGTTLFVIDSMAPDYENETGASATWDYSSYGGYNGESRTLTMLDPASTSYDADYPTATKVLDIQDFIKNFMYSSASERVSTGFVYSDADIGDVQVELSTDEAVQYQYPFALNDQFTDNYEGTATYNVGGSQTSPATGTLTASVDGTGELILADGVQFNNVTRYKLVETTEVTGTPLGDVILDRVQYEYYDLANSTMPVFVHTYVNLGPGLAEFNLVLSNEDPQITASTDENNLLEATRLYPNPASNELNVQLPENVNEANVIITDATGREVLSQEVSAVHSLDVNAIKSGMYFVTIAAEGVKETKSVVIE